MQTCLAQLNTWQHRQEKPSPSWHLSHIGSGCASSVVSVLTCYLPSLRIGSYGGVHTVVGAEGFLALLSPRPVPVRHVVIKRQEAEFAKWHRWVRVLQTHVAHKQVHVQSHRDSKFQPAMTSPASLS
eukprot:2028523-Amphidinium_carterae.1